MDKAEWNAIMRVVSKTLNVSVEDIKGKSRKQPILFARYCVLHFISLQQPKATLYAKVDFLGYKEHRAVMHAIETIKNLIATEDKKFMPALHKCMPKIKALFPDENETGTEPQ